jgi:hypothetical protein
MSNESDESNKPTETTEPASQEKVEQTTEKKVETTPTAAPQVKEEPRDMYGLTPSDWNDWDKAKRAMYEHFQKHLNEEVETWLPKKGR